MESALAPQHASVFLHAQTQQPSLHFMVCGSVDDGKSTLIGRMLFDAGEILEDQLQVLTTDSRKYGTQGNQVDFALLVDGLQAEREQGITIDVAYRYFATPKRRFRVADSPGHEQYTRNMATAASSSDLAVILVDASKGILTQTRRHTQIVSLVGVRHVVLAVNKMDLMNYDRAVFEEIVGQYRELIDSLGGFETFQAIPISALDGANIAGQSGKTPWYQEPGLLSYLESISVIAPNQDQFFRMPVQWVNRPNPDFRGFCGRIAAGKLSVDDTVQVLPSGQISRVETILLGHDKRSEVYAGDSVTLTLTDDLEVSRGDMIVSARQPVPVSDQFEARLLWMSETPMFPGRSYLLKLHGKEVIATVTKVKARIDVNTGTLMAATSINLNEIAIVNISFSQPVAFEPYEINRTLGGFILIDRMSFETSGAGMIVHPLRRASNVQWQSLEINKQARAEMMCQRPRCVWITGLSGSGKSTIANLLEKKLFAEGKHTYILDGDNIRHGLNRDLGFTHPERVENIRRVAEVAKLMVDAGLIVIVAFISPYRAERHFARELFAEGEFIEVFVDTPLEECERRDPKGLYAKARRGELKNFTGIDNDYEPPENPEVYLRNTDKDLLSDAVNQLMACLV